MSELEAAHRQLDDRDVPREAQGQTLSLAQRIDWAILAASGFSEAKCIELVVGRS